jgi:hypothetical protein
LAKDTSRVLSLRQRLGLVDYDAARGTPMLTLNQAADRLGVGPWVLRRLITLGILEATQVVRCAPWQLDPAVLDTEAIRTAAKTAEKRTLVSTPLAFRVVLTLPKGLRRARNLR